MYIFRHSKRDVFLISKHVPAYFNKMAYRTFRNIVLQYFHLQFQEKRTERAGQLLRFPFYSFLICLGIIGEELVKEQCALLSNLAITVRRLMS